MSAAGIAKGAEIAAKLGKGFVKFGKQAGRSFKEVPVTAAATGLFAGEIVGGPILHNLFQNRTRRAIELGFAEEEVTSEDIARIGQLDALSQAVAATAANVAATDPHFYNELIAGRKLPRGVIPIGGQPNTPLIEQIMLSASQGHFDRPAEYTMEEVLGP